MDLELMIKPRSAVSKNFQVACFEGTNVGFQVVENMFPGHLFFNCIQFKKTD